MAAKDTTTGARVRMTAIVIGIVLISAFAVLVFLVLTGIIAEPETVIEQIARMLLGS